MGTAIGSNCLVFFVLACTRIVPQNYITKIFYSQINCVHKIARQIKNVVAAGSFVILVQLKGVDHGLAQLAWHPAFIKAVGANDGCHIRIKPPGGNKEDYLITNGFIAYKRRLF